MPTRSKSKGTIATWQEQADSGTPTLWTYGYDQADQLTSATDTNTSTSAVISRYVYGYDPAGNRTSEQLGLGVTQTSVNNLNEVTGASAGGPLQFTGTLSKPSQVTVAGNTATSGNYYSTNFAGMADVTTGTNNVPIIAHDVNGNTATNTYQVVVPPGSSVTPTYDDDGNLTSNGNGQSYTWDALNELTTITYTGGATSNFTYDALGRRIAIVEKNSGGTVTNTKQFVWVGESITEERDASNAVTKRFFPQGEQISGTSYYYTRDHLGSVREMTDSSGTIQARYDYDPYGRVTAITSTIPSDFQYAGMYAHATSSLNLTLYRAYDPNTAKWLSRDPLEEGADTTLYTYVLNDPINDIDPMGLYPVVVVTTSGGTQYTPMTQVKNPAQAQKLGLPVGTPVPIAVPPGIDPQAAVNQFKNSWDPTPLSFYEYWKDPSHNYKKTNPMYDAYGNFSYGATGAADGFSCKQLQDEANKQHGGKNSPINTNDIQNGYNAIHNGGTLSTKEYTPPVPVAP